MSGPFETLIYTDCRLGMGLSGTAGMQFQARSPRADEHAMTLVRNNLLYEPPAVLMHHRRPPSDYPPSFAHSWDGILATASGVYLGRGISSGREGNQLTHAIVTRDPASYGFVRPAQLFGAHFWRSRPVDSTTCEPIPAGWTPGPFDAMCAQEFVRSQPKGAELLCSLVSALQRIEPGVGELRRIVFVAREAQPVLNWLAAATLLLPQQRALAIGFKVFATNPAFAKHPVVAVHPDWGTFSATLHNDLGYTIVDLIRQESSQVAVTQQAQIWTELFLTQNPYDVVDAVEFVAASGLSFDSALPVAIAAIMNRLPDMRAAEEAVSWLQNGPRELAANYAVGITRLLLDSDQQWPTALLLRLDRAGIEGSFQEQRKAVRIRLLDAALADALAGDTTLNTAIEPLPPLLWTFADETAAVQRVVAAIKAARVDRIEPVLRTAGFFSLPLAAATVGAELEAFVSYWAQRPDLLYRSELWPCQDDITALLHKRLTTLLEETPAAADKIGKDWWPLLLVEPFQIRTKLDAVVISTAMRHLPSPQRLEVVQACLGPHQSARRLLHAASQLWLRTPPTLVEAQLLTSLIPRGATLGAGAFATLDEQVSSGVAIADAIEAGEILRKHGVWQPSPQAARMWTADRQIAQLCHDLRHGAVQPALSHTRRTVPDFMLIARELQIQEALIKAALAASVLAVLRSMPWLTPKYQERLARELINRSDPVHVVMAFLLTRPQLTADLQSYLDGDRDEALKRMIQKWILRASQDRREQASAQIRVLSPPIPEEWRSLLHQRRGWRRIWPGSRG